MQDQDQDQDRSLQDQDQDQDQFLVNRFNIPLNIMDHFRSKSFCTISCTGNENQTQNKQREVLKNIKYTKPNPNTIWAPIKDAKHTQIQLKLNQRSLMRLHVNVHNCGNRYIIQHMIFSSDLSPPGNTHRSDAAYQR